VHLIGRFVVACLLAVVASILVWLAPATVHSGARAVRSAGRGATPTATAPPVPTATPRPVPAPQTAATTVLAYPAPPIQAKAALLIDASDGQVLYSKNANAELPMASTTKITTAVLTLEHAKLSAMVRVSEQAATIGQSTMGLRAGEVLTVRQLLYGLLLNSGNDAAIALAQYVGGTVQHFVVMMNTLAHTLHMTHTHYVTPHGLDEPHHYTSAHDLAIIAQYAMRDPRFRQIVATKSYVVPATSHNAEHWLENVNQVLFWYPGVDGVKPGNTDNAGLCQVVDVQRDGKHLLAVLLNTPNLITDIRNLLDFGLHDFRWVQGPAYWDTPSSDLSGGEGNDAWVYYLGAGHYIRGAFLSYFQSHGGVDTLGYPRTEQIDMNGHTVQFFQNAELIYDRKDGFVYQAPLGPALAEPLAVKMVTASVDTRLWPLYNKLGGGKVLGPAIAPARWMNHDLLQFYQHGVLARVDGKNYIVPAGDDTLRKLGWLPATGAANAYPAVDAPGITLVPPSSTAPAGTSGRKVRHRATA